MTEPEVRAIIRRKERLFMKTEGRVLVNPGCFLFLKGAGASKKLRGSPQGALDGYRCCENGQDGRDPEVG